MEFTEKIPFEGICRGFTGLDCVVTMDQIDLVWMRYVESFCSECDISCEWWVCGLVSVLGGATAKLRA